MINDATENVDRKKCLDVVLWFVCVGGCVCICMTVCKCDKSWLIGSESFSYESQGG